MKRTTAKTTTKLEIARQMAGISLSALAKLSGVSRDKLVRWEFGRSDPSIETMFRVQMALFNSNPFIFERVLFKSDKEFEDFLNSESFSNFQFKLNKQKVLADEMEKEKNEALVEALIKKHDSSKDIVTKPIEISQVIKVEPNLTKDSTFVRLEINLLPLPMQLDIIVYTSEDIQQIERIFNSEVLPIIKQHLRAMGNELEVFEYYRKQGKNEGRENELAKEGTDGDTGNEGSIN